jgi:hypothetical protein
MSYCHIHPSCKAIFEQQRVCCHCEVNDDQMSTLMSIAPQKMELSKFDFKEHELDARVNLILDAVPLDLAKRCRTLINEVSIIPGIKRMNNDDNAPPRNIIVNGSKYIAPSGYSRWMWRNYSEGIWRLFPADYKTFAESPINELVNYINNRFSQDPLRPATWVIQLTRLDKKIGWHFDEYIGRKIAFIYYLTPDDWDYKKDGGNLMIRHKDGNIFSINPTFNSLIMWKMGLYVSHAVNSVIRDCFRVALVGFYNT